MKILNEKEETFVNVTLDMSETEINNLLNYYETECSDECKKSLKINWAVNDILENRLN